MGEKPLLAVTMGDPAGIGPEIIVKSLYKSYYYDILRPLVIGDSELLKKSLQLAKVELRVNSISQPEEALFVPGVLDVINIDNPGSEKISFGRNSKEAGYCSYSYIERAIDLAMQRRIDGVVTGPISKVSLHLAGYGEYAGHTEIFARKTGTENYAMLLVVDDLYILHVSTHLSMLDACKAVKRNRISRVIDLARDFIDTYKISNDTIAISGLNPHAGEDGAFGVEEVLEIIPAVEEAKLNGCNIVGPLPPDTVFVKAQKKQFQVIIAMYHDQGHIPAKIIDFDHGVNVTLGLPIIRTSVDHGTAFGKAGKGTASSASMEAALLMGCKMARAKFYDI